MPSPAYSRLASLFPPVGPWTAAALWHGLYEVPTPNTPIEPELRLLVGSRLAGLALSYCRSRPDADVGAGALGQLQQGAFRWTSASLSTTQASRTAVDTLAARGIGSVVTKGAGIAAHYPDVTLRPYSDIDLLVDRADFAAALSALQGSGWDEELKNHQPRAYFRRYCREGTNLHAGEFGSVDLHHSIPPWVWGTGLDAATVSARAVAVPAGGTTLLCAAPEDNLLIAALHVVSDRNQPGQSLIVWRDVLQLAAASDHDVVVQRARSVGLDGWLRAVLDAVPAVVRPAALRTRLTADTIPHSARLSALLSPRSARLGIAATQPLRLPWGNAALFAAGMAVPSTAFVRAKFTDSAHPYVSWWSRGRR